MDQATSTTPCPFRQPVFLYKWQVLYLNRVYVVFRSLPRNLSCAGSLSRLHGIPLTTVRAHPGSRSHTHPIKGYTHTHRHWALVTKMLGFQVRMRLFLYLVLRHFKITLLSSRWYWIGRGAEDIYVSGVLPEPLNHTFGSF